MHYFLLMAIVLSIYFMEIECSKGVERKAQNYKYRQLITNEKTTKGYFNQLESEIMSKKDELKRLIEFDIYMSELLFNKKYLDKKPYQIIPTQNWHFRQGR